jgi:hypothetical protein
MSLSKRRRAFQHGVDRSVASLVCQFVNPYDVVKYQALVANRAVKTHM